MQKIYSLTRTTHSLRAKRVHWMLPAVVLASGVWVATAQQVKKVDDSALRNAAKSGDEWLTYGHDYAETHYSPLKQITTENVKRLGLAWSFETDSPPGTVETTPLISNGVLYGSLPWGVLFAVDARTGKFKWRWDPEIPREHISTLCCGPMNRGVALYKGRVYAGLIDGTLAALDQETGKPIWRVKVVENDDTILTSAVRIVKGKVIVGSSGAEQAVRGHFSAYDAETGKRVWRFYTVPGDPSKPFEQPELAMAAKTWKGEWWKLGGGGTVWDAMAYDPDADILYVGTGNGGPWNQNYRSPGGGDNLFLSSIIAVKPDTGKMVWYFQETPGDMWDFTATQPMILADIRIDGRLRKVIMQAPKNGFFYVLDRITGEFISGKNFPKRVTWADGLDSKGRPIEAKGVRYTTEPITISPGAGGAHSWTPMSYNPNTGLVYLPGNEAPWTYVPDPNFQFANGFWNTGIMMGRRPPGPDGQPAAQAPRRTGPAKEPEGAENKPKASGPFLVAWDPAINAERWRLTGQGLGGGTLTTAGNLVFQGGHAYDATTGEKLWEVDLGGAPSTPVTYELDGKQYISLLARATPATRVFTFVLDGTEPMPPAPPRPPGRGGRGRGAGEQKGAPKQ
jgi:quinohemoprotein ethanol dehydrogenase